MAILAPLAFAGAGYLVGGTTGMAVGWLVGSWLFGPKADTKNQVFDPGAEEMPRINQSLRGSTLPVLFGTNRVSSHIVWVNNFTTIRHETKDSGGGGKGGGSGMKGPTSGGSTEVTYEYKWDMLWHLGMGPQEYSLFGGWIGADRMNDETLNNIIQGDAGTFTFFKSSVDRPRTAQLAFDEAYFGFGASTENDTADNWGHFETATGHPCRWPHTYYVGFKQLNLGNSARVPQCTFEIGPGNVESSYLTDFQSKATTVSDQEEDQVNGLTGFLTGEDGVDYYIDCNNSSSTSSDPVAYIIRVSDGVTIDTITPGEFDADVTSLGLDPGNNVNFSTPEGPFAAHIAGTPYFIVHIHNSTAGYLGSTEHTHAVVLYKINASGSVVALGGCRYLGQQFGRIPTRLNAIGIYGPGLIDELGAVDNTLTNDRIMLICSAGLFSARDRPLLVMLPTIADMDGGVIIEEAVSGPKAYFWNQNAHILQGSPEKYFGLSDGTLGENPSHGGRGFILPQAEQGLLGVEWTANVYFYISREMIAYHADGTTPSSAKIGMIDSAFIAANPDGALIKFNVKYDVNIDGSVTWTVSDHTVENANWQDRNGLSVMPLSDDGQNADGTLDSNYEEYNTYYNQTVLPLSQGQQGGWLVMFCKAQRFNQATHSAPTGSYAKVVGFIYNPLKTGSTGPVATLYATEDGSFGDTVADFGSTEGARYTNITRNLYPFFKQSTNELWLIASYSASDNIGDSRIFTKFGTLIIGGGTDVTPPYIIYQILTNPVFGLGIDASRVDIDSYADAVAYCEEEEIRVSVIYNREESVLGVIDELLSLYGGFLIDSGGIIRFGVAETTSVPVRTIDNDHLVVDGRDPKPPVIVTKGARQDGYNTVKVNFFDRDLEYRQNMVEITDDVDIDLHGVRAKEFQPKFVMKPQLAWKIAERALWTNLYAKDIYDFTLGWKDADLEPGDVITLVDSFHHELSTGRRCRIVQWRERERGRFDVRAVEESDYAVSATRSYSSVATPGAGSSLFSDVQAPADFRMYELPREFQGANANVYVGYNQLSNVMGAYLYLSAASGDEFQLVANAQPYIISGIFAQGLPLRDGGYVEQGVEIYLMPGSGFNPASPTWAQTHQLDDVSASLRAAGGGVIIAGSEALALQGVTLLGQNHYKIDYVFRGWGGTHIQAHNSGAYWHRHGGGMFVQQINEDRIGTQVFYKVVPYNFAGQPFNVSSIEAKQYTIRGAYWRPQVMPRVSVFVQSPLIGTASEDMRTNVFRGVASGGCDVVFNWPQAARLSGYGTGGYGAGNYGDFTADTSTPSYRVEVLSSDMVTVVRSTVVNTTQYTYNRAANSSDFGGWQGDFAVRFTPFNERGDAPRSVTRRLVLFA